MLADTKGKKKNPNHCDFQKRNIRYRNDPKFSDRQVWANSADPEQTAPRGEV